MAQDTADLLPFEAACHDRLAVRWCRPLPLVAVLLGCGEGPPTPPREPPSAGIAVAPSVGRAETSAEPSALPVVLSAAAEPIRAETPLSTAPVGHLEGPQRLTRLFEALARLDDGHAHDDVRILQYGDSHTASDLGVGVFRRALQGRFGDGGRGFVSIGKPWKTYVQDGVHGGMTKDFEPTKVKYRKGSFSGVDGCYGLLGVGVASSKAGARAWTSVVARSSRIEIGYGQDPRGGSFEVFSDQPLSS